MKKTKLLLFITILFLGFAKAGAQTTTKAATTSTDKNMASPVTGAWQSADQKEFVIMNDGFFSSIAQDSTGKWADTHAGTYTLDNANTLTLKVVHSSFPTHVGALHTVEYSLQGDMLTIKWFKKLVDAKDGDITAQLPKDTQTQYMRAKK